MKKQNSDVYRTASSFSSSQEITDYLQADFKVCYQDFEQWTHNFFICSCLTRMQVSTFFIFPWCNYNDFSVKTCGWYRSEKLSWYKKFKNQKLFLTISRCIMKGMFLFNVLFLFLAGVLEPDNLPLSDMTQQYFFLSDHRTNGSGLSFSHPVPAWNQPCTDSSVANHTLRVE